MEKEKLYEEQKTTDTARDAGDQTGMMEVTPDVGEPQSAAVPSRSEAIARLAEIVESTDDAIVSKNLDGTILSWNPGAERMFGYTAKEAIGRPIYMIYPPERLQEFPMIMERLRRGERIEHYETQRVRKDGTRLDVSVSVSPVRDDKGVIVGAAKIARNISESKRAERAQQFLGEATALLNSSLDHEKTLQNLARLAVPFIADWCVVYILQDDGQVRRLAMEHVEPEMADLARRVATEFKLNLDSPVGVPNVIRSGMSELYPDASAELLAADTSDPERMSELTAPLGVRSWMCIPLTTRGRTFGAMSFVSTVSGRRYSVQDLVLAEELARRAALSVDNARLYEEAQRAIRLRDQFLSVASHELKTPLTALLGYTELLQRYLERGPAWDGSAEHAAEVVHEQALRLNKLISALLDVSRIQEGRFITEQAPFDLRNLVRRVAAEQQETSSGHRIQIAGTTRPVVVLGDEMRMEQVVRNLLQNAAKYSLKGGPIAVCLMEENGQAKLSVSDSGIGIPANALPNLFTRFYRADNAEQLHVSGLGIGLYVVKEIVSLHGGTVDVESQEGNGSKFTVRLPLHSEKR